MADAAAERVTQSLELLAERVGDPAPQIYARLFRRFPETQERFARDTTGAVRGEMLTMVFGCLMDPGGPYQANLVRTERVNHDGFGTPSEVFDGFFGIVRETCRELLAGDWSPEFDAAWTAQIERVLTASK